MIFPQDKCTRLFRSLYFPLLKIFMGIRKAPTQNIWEMRFLKVCKTKKTELLFLALFLKMLKVGGRCACIVPDGGGYSVLPQRIKPFVRKSLRTIVWKLLFLCLPECLNLMPAYRQPYLFSQKQGMAEQIKSGFTI